MRKEHLSANFGPAVTFQKKPIIFHSFILGGGVETFTVMEAFLNRKNYAPSCRFSQNVYRVGTVGLAPFG